MPGVSVSRRMRSSLGRVSIFYLLLRELLTEAIDLPEGILGRPDHRPMTGKDDPDADRFHQCREGGDSGPNRPPIPIQIGHSFRSKSATCSDPNRPGIPAQIGHPYDG